MIFKILKHLNVVLNAYCLRIGVNLILYRYLSMYLSIRGVWREEGSVHESTEKYQVVSLINFAVKLFSMNPHGGCGENLLPASDINIKIPIF